MAALLAGLLIGATAVALAPGKTASDPKRAEIERIVRDYLLANPEVIRDAARVLQEREIIRTVEANREALETPYGNAWAGNANGDVVLVEFFDYACGFCRKSIADVDRLLKEDKNLKVVWRDLPVLGPDSQAAAQASLTAAAQGKFRTFYDALFAAGRPTTAAIASARQAAGVSTAGGRTSHQGEIDKNYSLAQAIGASGTPTFVIGGKVLQGAVGYDALKSAIAEARAN